MAGSSQHTPRNTRRRKNQEGEAGTTSATPNLDSGIPYIEANQDIGEVPLDHIDSFVIPARDERGQFAKQTFHLPPYLTRQMQIVVRSNRFPYIDVNDFIRHALARHVKFCAAIRQSIPKHITQVLETMLEVSRDNDIRIRAHEAYVEIERQVQACVGRGDAIEAVRLLNVVKSRLDGVHQSPAVHELREQLQTQFDYVMGRDGSLRKR